MKAWEKDFIIFGADMSVTALIVDKNKDILTLGEWPTQELHDTTLTAEAKYEFYTTKKKICIKSTPWWKQRFLIC